MEEEQWKISDKDMGCWSKEVAALPGGLWVVNGSELAVMANRGGAKATGRYGIQATRKGQEQLGMK